ncbi:MAG TPA: BTAD domain-containing putative transcriptional regulator [Ornithinibacter sp.]|nr:BTAD domain-containing putative transcriptional regulator [Ornithinibacter sp.]
MTPAHRPSSAPLLVTAAAGYGKSALLEALRPDRGVVLAASDLVSDGLPEGVPWVGVDDVDRLTTAARTRVVAELAARGDVEVVLACGAALPAELHAGNPARMRERVAADLALTPYAVAVLLAQEYGVTDPEAALLVAELTAGWPVLVHLAGDALARDPHADLTHALCAPAAPAAQWVGSHVLAALPSWVANVLRTAATVDERGPVTATLVETLSAPGSGCPASDVVDLLVRMGVLVSRRRVGTATEAVLVPVLAGILARGTEAPPAAAVRAAASVVAAVHESEQAWLPAARAHAVAGDRGAVVRLVGRYGEDMLRRGDAAAVARLVEQVVGGGLDEPLLLRTRADALRMSGEPARARRAFAPLVARAEADGWEPGLAARVAGLHYLCGEFESALTVLDRCPDASPGGYDVSDEDVVDWLAGRVHVLAMLGRPAEAHAAAERCLTVAELTGDPRPLGVAHLAVARTCRGTRKDLHHEHAVRYAALAGDAVTATRALAARTCLLLASAAHAQALDAAREAARMARLACPPGMQAVALHNLGEALARTGRLDEALWQLECSVSLCRRLGPARAALGLVGVAHVHRSLGRAERSRSAYTEAAELARGSGDAQVLVSALSGLALLACDDPTPQAEEAVAEALRIAPADLLPVALTAAGRVAAARGDTAAAVEHARRAVACAREVRAADLLAEALELEAEVVDDAARSRAALGEALSIWSGGGAGPAAARVEVLIGQLPDADGTERSRARDAARSLRRLGISGVGVSPGADCAEGVVSVSVLGPFTVTVAGAEVPLPAWRSRQARTLVKILAAHRGRVVTRARLCDLLWPDDDPARTGHRLSVLLATVRGVLDPAKAWPPDRFVAADQFGVRLDLSTVVLDADLLLRDADHATALLDTSDDDRAREVLAHVDVLYRGEAFEDESDEWADPLREEVRAAWVRSVRRLATLRSREGRGAEALGIFVRLLSVDPYDEQVHRRLVTTLVRAGRHGEARRAFQRWHHAMAEIDAPLPDERLVSASLTQPGRPAVLTPR